MCGRYVTPEQGDIEREWDLRGSASARFLQRYIKETFANPDASPGQRVPLLRVVRDAGGARELTEARWGLIPHWANGEPPKDRAGRPLATFNARIETLRSMATFRQAWARGQRCLVPVRGFYEWQAQPPDWQRTVRHYITVNDQQLFSFAGLWEQSGTAAGSVQSVTVITMPANELMNQIHNSRKRGARRELLPEEERRMPAILRREDQDTWLSGTAEAAWAVLKPYSAQYMVAWLVQGPVDPRNEEKSPCRKPQ